MADGRWEIGDLERKKDEGCTEPRNEKREMRKVRRDKYPEHCRVLYLVIQLTAQGRVAQGL